MLHSMCALVKYSVHGLAVSFPFPPCGIWSAQNLPIPLVQYDVLHHSAESTDEKTRSMSVIVSPPKWMRYAHLHNSVFWLQKDINIEIYGVEVPSLTHQNCYLSQVLLVKDFSKTLFAWNITVTIDTSHKKLIVIDKRDCYTKKNKSGKCIEKMDRVHNTNID